jgi:hypothetical protein
METAGTRVHLFSLPTPHSLGKLIEWKHVVSGEDVISIIAPHSLGKLIEWKQLVSAIVLVWGIRGICTPHSLGKLIEWKRAMTCLELQKIKERLPTRWGN